MTFFYALLFFLLGWFIGKMSKKKESTPSAITPSIFFFDVEYSDSGTVYGYESDSGVFVGQAKDIQSLGDIAKEKYPGYHLYVAIPKAAGKNEPI